MATYYVSQAGAGDGSAVGTPDSVADFNADVFGDLSDDTVYFLGTITSTITMPRGGTAGHPVTLIGNLAGYECSLNSKTVIASGAWTPDDPVAGTYSRSPAYTLAALLQNDVLLPMATAAACADGNWFYVAGSTLYYKPTSGVVTDWEVAYCKNSYGINLSNYDYITVSGFTILNQFYGIGHTAAAGENSSNIIIDSCNISRCRDGIRILPNASTATNVTITNNTISYCGRSISINRTTSGGTDTLIISGNTLAYTSQVYGAAYNWETPYPAGDLEGIGVQDTINASVFNNNISGMGRGIVWFANTGASSYNNNIYGNTISELREAIMMNPHAGATAYYDNNVFNNYILNSGSDSTLKASVRLYSPTSPGTTYNSFSNNTIVNSNLKAIALDASADYWKIQNNISSGVTDYHIWAAQPSTHYVTYSNNCYYPTKNFNDAGTARTFAEWQALDGSHDANSMMNSDPLLTTHILLPDSPCIRAGMTIESVTNDIDGRKRPGRPGNKYSIGCWEYLGTNDPDRDENCRLPYR